MKEYLDYKYRFWRKFKLLFKKVDCYLFFLLCLLIFDELLKCSLFGILIMFFVIDFYLIIVNGKMWLFLFVLLGYIYDLSFGYFIIVLRFDCGLEILSVVCFDMLMGG